MNFIRVFTLLVLFGWCAAAPTLNFTSPTPADNYAQSSTSVPLNVSIASSNLSSLAYNWNGTNYTLYGDSLVFMANFANNSALGENSTTALDLSRFGIWGNLSSGASYAAGKYGSGVHVDGSTGYVSFANTSSYNPSLITISAWIKADAWAPYSYIGTIVSTDEWAGASHYSRGYVVRIGGSGGGAISFNIGFGGNSTWFESTTGPLMSANTWYHIAATFNGTQQRVYINGVLRNSTNTPAGVIAPSTYPLNIGRCAFDNNVRVFNGTIDEVRIWNRSLSDQEIYQEYASNLQKSDSAQWYLYVNQSKNASAGLDLGTYTYQAFATDPGGSGQSAQQTVTIGPIVSACGQPLNVSGTTYTLNQSVSSASTCFSITAANVTLDCAGFSILGNNASGSVGVYSNQTRPTVRNCVLSNLSTGVSLNSISGAFLSNDTFNLSYNSSCSYSTGACCGVFLNQSNSSQINWSVFTLSPGAYAIAANGGSGHSILSNRFSSVAYAIYLYATNNSTISANNVTFATATPFYLTNGASYNTFCSNNVSNASSASDTVLFLSSAGPVSLNNSILNNSFVSSGYGITLSGSSVAYTQIANNTLRSSGTQYGLRLMNTHDNLITNNTVIGFSYGLYLSSASNHSVSNNSLYNVSSYAVFISGSNNNLSDNLVYNTIAGFYVTGVNSNQLIHNTANKTQSGFVLLGSSSNITLINNTAISASSEGFSITGSASNNTLINNSAHSSATGFSVKSSSLNNTLLNNTAFNSSSNGFLLDTSANRTTLFNNTANSCAYGFLVSTALNNLTNNTARNSTYYGLYLSGALNNSIWGNYMDTLDNGVSYARGAAYLTSSSANNVFSCNTFNSTSTSSTAASSIYLNSSQNNTFTNNTLQMASSIGTSAINAQAVSGGNTFLYNNITAPIWVSDSNGTNVYNDSARGNIYYFINGTASWSVLPIYNNGSSNWAVSGSARPFNATTASGYWNGLGQDWFPYASSFNLTCSNLSAAGASYVLTANQSANGSCFNITADNILLDCNGYTLSGGNSSGTYGVYSIANNATIKNCRINNFQYGIGILGNGSTVTNNTLQITYGALGSALFVNSTNASNLFYLNNLTSTVWVRVVGQEQNLTQTVSEGGTVSLSCGNGNVITAFSSSYGANCLGTCPVSCGTCAIGESSCSITYNNANCGDCCNGCPKNGQLNLTCGNAPAFNTSSQGNIYYFDNGTASWDVFNILYNRSNPNWTRFGSSRPFKSAAVGGNWSGLGSDWVPFTLNLAVDVYGNSSSINTSGSNPPENLSVLIDSVNASDGQYLEGAHLINITSQGQPLFEFSFNFTNASINFSQVSLSTGQDGGRTYASISGINSTALTGGKTLYLYNASTSYTQVCVKDAEGVSYSDVSSACNAADEHLLSCNGTNQSGYTCTLSGTTLTISGLNHSAAMQFAAPATSTSSGGSSYSLPTLAYSFDCASGALNVSVRTAGGSAISDISVTLADAYGSFSRTQSSDSDGLARFSIPSSGSYRIESAARDYYTAAAITPSPISLTLCAQTPAQNTSSTPTNPASTSVSSASTPTSSPATPVSDSASSGSNASSEVSASAASDSAEHTAPAISSTPSDLSTSGASQSAPSTPAPEASLFPTIAVAGMGLLILAILAVLGYVLYARRKQGGRGL